jgi:hypothetical protein
LQSFFDSDAIALEFSRTIISIVQTSMATPEW